MTDQFDSSPDADQLDPTHAVADSNLAGLVLRTDAFAKRTKKIWTITGVVFAVLTVGRVAGAYGERPVEVITPKPVPVVVKEVAPPVEVVPEPAAEPEVVAEPEPEPEPEPAPKKKRSKSKKKSKKK